VHDVGIERAITLQPDYGIGAGHDFLEEFKERARAQCMQAGRKQV
jgi:hypothetical protein